MSIPDKNIPVPTASLDVSVQYKSEFLNNCSVGFFTASGSIDTGMIPLGDSGRKSIILSQTNSTLTLRLSRKPQPPQDDPSKYPVLAGDYPFGPVTGNVRVIIVATEPHN